MKIRKIKYNNHPVLGNLELNFVNPTNDTAFDTIVLIGENGVGKTTIMTTISEFLNSKTLKPFEYIEYEADGHQYHIEPSSDRNSCFHTRKEIGSDSEENIRRDKYNDPQTMYADKKDLRSYASVFSKARADFQVGKIGGISTNTLDSEMQEMDDTDDYTSLKQLIVDIDSQDSNDFKKQNREHNIAWESFYPTSRMYRFANAFDSFFDKMKFDRIETVNKDNVIQFKKSGNDVAIDDLSTGEKQIVYRGAYLLKNNGRMDGGAVFIDEPELSMHPAWQRRILDYFQRLYKTPTGQQKAQMFFASHSEYVVESALKQKGKTVVIVLKEVGGIITGTPITMPSVLQTIMASEVNYTAFGVNSVDYHIALYGEIQRRFRVSRITECDKKIESCTPYYKPEAHERCTPNPNKPSEPYKTICTKVRNHIDHPNTAPAFTEEELGISIELMREILKNVPITS